MISLLPSLTVAIAVSSHYRAACHHYLSHRARAAAANLLLYRVTPRPTSRPLRTYYLQGASGSRMPRNRRRQRPHIFDYQRMRVRVIYLKRLHRTRQINDAI